MEEIGTRRSSPISDHGRSSPTQVLLFVGSVVFLVVLMYVTYNSSSVCGQPINKGTFVFFFFRELILLAFLAIAIAAAIVCRLLDFIRQAFAKKA